LKIFGSEVKAGKLPLLFFLSLIFHLGCWHLIGGAYRYEFAPPLKPLDAVIVSISDCAHAPTEMADGSGRIKELRYIRSEDPDTDRHISQVSTTLEREALGSSADAVADHSPQSDSKTEKGNIAQEQKVSDHPGSIAEPGGGAKPDSSTGPFLIDYSALKGSVHNAVDFLVTGREKLTYRISLLKIPVGTAIIEAINKDCELRISTRISSNSVLSTIYPVDDQVETRMIKGNYLLTRVRQKEGNYRGDFGFTLMLREHKAFWVDRIRSRYDYQPLPDENTMDVVSGFYYLRNLQMEVGKEISLPIFDSEEYALTQVEVERRERISLPGGNEVDTLVIHPLFKTAGFFRRTGDIRIWLTNDRFRVPVRLETFITLGKVTAELISAESEQ
jgi:hypothetical protein